MPAKSQAQRGFLAHKFGREWMKKHGFANKGKLPVHVKKNRRHQQSTVNRRLWGGKSANGR